MKKFQLLIAFCIVSLQMNAQSTWVKDTFFTGANISQIAEHKEKLYASSDNSLYRSVNNGEYWETVDSVPGYGYTYALLDYGNRFFVYNSYGLHYTEDEGETWVSNFINFGTPDFHFFFSQSNKLLLKGDTLLFVNVYMPVQYSLDTGTTWQEYHFPIPSIEYPEIYIDGNRTLLDDFDTIFFSNDNIIWNSKAKAGYSEVFMHEDIIYLDGYGSSQSLFTTDFGQSWEDLPDSINIDLVKYSTTQQNGYWYSKLPNQNYLYRSNDFWVTYDSLLFFSTFGTLGLNCAFSNDLNTVFLGTAGGPILYTPVTGEKSYRVAGMHESWASINAFPALNAWVASIPYERNYLSYNNGLDWEPIDSKSISHYLFVSSTGLIYRVNLDIGIETATQLDGVFTLVPGSENYKLYFRTPIWDNDTLYLYNSLSNHRIRIKPNGVIEDLNNQLYDGFINGAMYRFDISGGNSILRSTDNGQTWTPVYQTAPGVYPDLFNLFQVENRIFCSLGSYDSVLYSDDNGLTWNNSKVNGKSTNSQAFYLMRSNNGVIWVTDHNNVFYSLDKGLNWSVYTHDIPQVSKDNAFFGVLDNTIKVGTRYGLWSKSIAPFETVKGTVFHDQNNNGVRDASESGQPNMLLTQTNTSIKTRTDNAGLYTFAASNNDTIRVSTKNIYATVNPPFSFVENTAEQVDFALHYLPNIYDLALNLVLGNALKPGQASTIQLVVKNEGTTQQNALLWLKLPKGVTFLQSQSNTPSYIVEDTLFWADIDLPFSVNEDKITKKIEFQVHTEDTVSLNQPLALIAQIGDLNLDYAPEDNKTQLQTLPVENSAPFEKLVYPALITPEEGFDGERLQYTIRFKNTLDYATNYLHIVDSISPMLDLSTFEIVSSSHNPVIWSIENDRKLSLRVNNINFPSGAEGFVSFSIRSVAALNLGDSIENKANVRINWNAAFDTNIAVAKVAEPPVTPFFDEGVEMIVAPNPSSGEFKLLFETPITGTGTLKMLDSQGGILNEYLLTLTDGESPIFDLSLPIGTYTVWVEMNGEVYTSVLMISF